MISFRWRRKTASVGGIISQPPDVGEKLEAIQSFKARINSRRGIFEKSADWLTAAFGTITFFLANAIVFLIWLLWNTGHFFGLHIIDPYPFGLLTTAVSLEAIFLSVIVLISQNREGKIAELREEMELYIDTYSESEITKLMYLVTLLLEKQGIDISEDSDVQKMLGSLEPDSIEEQLVRGI